MSRCSAHPLNLFPSSAQLLSASLVRVTLGHQAFQLIALVGRTARHVRVPALESVAHAVVSAARRLRTVAQVARRVLVIVTRAQEEYRLTVCAGRMGGPARGQQVMEIVVRQPVFAEQLLHIAAQVRVAKQLMATVS